MNPPHRCLRRQIQHVGTGTAEAENSDCPELKLIGDGDDLCAAGGRVAIVERVVVLRVGRYHGKRLRRERRINPLCRAGQDGDVGRHLGVVVRIGVGRLRLCREGVIDRHSLNERMRVAAVLDFRDFGTILIAGVIAGKIGDMRVGTARLVAGQHQLDDEDAAFHFLVGIYIRDVLH